MASRKPTAPASNKAAELEAAFAAEGITIQSLIHTLNEVRTDAQRYSTKTGEPVGADHQARGKAACDLLELLGLPDKKAFSGTPAAPRSIASELAPPNLCRRCHTSLADSASRNAAGDCHIQCEFRDCPPPSPGDPLA